MKVGPFDVEVIGLREIVRKNKEEIEAEYKPSAALHAAQGRVQRWNVCVGTLSVFAPTGELQNWTKIVPTGAKWLQMKMKLPSTHLSRDQSQ